MDTDRKKYFNTVRNLLKKNGAFYLFQSATEKDTTIDNEEDHVTNNISFEHRKMLDNGEIIRHSGCGGMPVSLAQYCVELKNAGFKLLSNKIVNTPVRLFVSIVASINSSV